MDKKKLIVFSAPSGGGKTTLVRYIVDRFNNTEFSISATSRDPRGKEIDGIDYYFLSKSEFKKNIEKGNFIEYEEVYGGLLYGTLKSEIDRIWGKNKIVVFDIDVVGGINIKEKFPDKTLSIFIMPPSIEVLKKRLIDRGDVSPEQIKIRIQKAKNEINFASKFDSIIVNNDLNESKEIAFSLIKKFLKNE